MGAARKPSALLLISAAVALVAVLVSIAACSPRDPLPWEDDFSDPESGWRAESDASAEVRYADGIMLVRVNWPDKLSWASAGRDLSDFHVSVEAAQVSGPDDNEYGILARIRDGKRFYMFAISGDGYYRVVRRDGAEEAQLTNDWTYSDAIHKGAAINRIEAHCQGETLTMSVNGVVVAQVRDKGYAHGDIGLYAGTFRDPGEGVEIHFDDLVVSRP